MKPQKTLFFLLLTFFVFSLIPAISVRAQAEDEDAMLREDLAPYLEKEETARWSLTNPFSEALVQTAEKQVQTIKSTPASIDVITGEEIKRYGYPTLIEFLSTLPGFYSYYPRDYRIAGVRGFCRQGSWNNRILILVDGHSINSDFDGSSFVEEDFGVNLDAVDRIEIVRGPGSSLYGSNALFAVVNIISKSGEKIDGVMGKAGIASYGTWMTGGAFGKKIGDKIDVMASGQFLDSSGRDLYYPEYEDPENGMSGRSRDADSLRNWVAFTKISYQDLSFKFQAKDRKKGLPQGAYFTSLGDDRNFLRDGSGFAEVRWDPRLTPDLSLSSRVYADFVHYNGSYYYTGDEYPLSLEGWDDWYTGGEVKLNWKQSRFFKLLGGGEYQYHWQDFWLSYQTDEGEIDPDSDPDWTKNSGTGAVFLHGKIEPWEKLSLNLGLRYDYFPGFGGEINPRAGVIYTPYSSGTIKLLYGQAFRAPSRYEYDYTDIYYYLPNDALDPEKLYTYELVFEQSIRQNLFLSVSAYLTDIDNLINQVEIYDPTQIEGNQDQEVIDGAFENPEPDEAVFLQFQNSGSIRSIGADLSLRAKWPSGIEGFLNTTLQKTEETSAGETHNLSNSPAVFGNVGLSFPFPYTRKHLFLSPHFQFSGERDIQGTEDESGNPLTTGAYLLTNVNLVWKDWPKGLETSLGVYNLFNVKYSFPGGGDFLQNRLRADGINFRFLVSYLIQ